ncbi:hypothetical protein Thivi_1891 [Thiocystis violascens DSM 198]|uniref:Uncharacterized protein n=1 Tax=Thiocystis violascens (strain ATCC 17096 / DSM 198 / 6111) TaxID=765911 RepID=I3YA41_THIV6|nr:hypothetical protein Thivi_1891 [Thiocystis violascens DSM 198]
MSNAESSGSSSSSWSGRDGLIQIEALGLAGGNLGQGRGGAHPMQCIQPHRRVLVVLQGEEVGNWAALDHCLGVDAYPGAVASDIFVHNIESAALRQRGDDRGEDSWIDHRRLQPQGVGENAHAFRVERQTVRVSQQALPESIELALARDIGRQRLDVPDGVFPAQIVVGQLILQVSRPLIA